MVVTLALCAAVAGLHETAASAMPASCSSAYRKSTLEDQIRLYTLCLERGLRPEARAGAHNNRGVAYMELGDVDSALEDFTQAIRYDDDWGQAYFNCAQIHLARGDLAAAEADLDQATWLPPARNRGTAFAQRADLRAHRGDYAGALEDFDEAIRRKRREPSFLGNRAWLLATCPDPAYRNGEEAIELALRARELEDRWQIRDTLAAAYAEAGRFEDAVLEQLSAIEAADAAGVDTTPLRARVELYRSGVAFRSGPLALEG
jgi:tetratricopeptide (TPR) repeat protein